MNNKINTSQLPHSADLPSPTFLVLFCRVSICFGILVALAPFVGILGLLVVGLREHEGFLSLINNPLWHIYLEHLLVGVCGILLFTGGKWSLERKPLGWHLMSFCSLMAALYLGRLTCSIVPFDEPASILVIAPLFLLFTAGYVYLFTDRPRTFLNVTRPKRWQMFSLHIALYVFLRLLYSLLSGLL